MQLVSRFVAVAKYRKEAKTAYKESSFFLYLKSKIAISSRNFSCQIQSRIISSALYSSLAPRLKVNDMFLEVQQNSKLNDDIIQQLLRHNSARKLGLITRSVFKWTEQQNRRDGPELLDWPRKMIRPWQVSGAQLTLSLYDIRATLTEQLIKLKANEQYN